MRTYLTREKNRWRVRVKIGGKLQHVGYYLSIEKALDAIKIAKALTKDWESDDDDSKNN